MTATASALSPGDNLWHREWMERTQNAYEWWYLDCLSSDGVWSLVVIFLLGNPFSPYTRLCSLGVNPDPFEHNAVFASLHKNGRLHHYLFAKYPKRSLEMSDSGMLNLIFSQNSWRQDSNGLFEICLNEENANRRRIVATLRFFDPLPFPIAPLDLGDESAAHTWLPVIPAGKISVKIDLFAPAISREAEHIEFDGSAYHDHNWGVLPFDSSIARWIWSRADFGGGEAALLYSIEPVGKPARNIVIYRGNEGSITNDNAEVTRDRGRRSPLMSGNDRLTAKIGDKKVSWSFGTALDSSPIYSRSLVHAEIDDGKSIRTGVGMGEMLKPRGLDSKLIAEAMRLRIYEPGI